mmetsp:Transcript_18917/g.34292  ORF Transcript_18917/g.34292 Transcript_18917/m.34292 type:complete len:238 (-) Transcript_18917:231-944(-)|eukprot:CAMPEP_0175060464 /NCGR_PEP_ID=MMETSP0052_2-20121109/13027_1 /TAXON_ID=51329 ORGANISM="Polytomella parva, Strain SAG 63-3" /NCGR_SAMPLE_ID=MMETSP0052_2 /ASSEMBLY_ACC=CAM_ASM_000194 /LENGTH=237 /DNA_ID=CAMNT_0016326177 /DNA_START=42 /DNA_END=755 /DNA_ORIENTATION=-
METASIVASVLLIILSILLWRNSKGKKEEERPKKFYLGDVTLESLQFYCGMEFARPVLLAISGVVYDVSSRADLFYPGRKYQAYAGMDCARALAKDSVEASDCTSNLEGLTDEELQRLEEKKKEFVLDYPIVGQVVPLKKFTLEELAQYDGRDESKPYLLAVEGLIYDITTGKHFYGPNGTYPFAGKEVARALALLSTEESDLNSSNVKDLSPAELDTLHSWKAKFNLKYPIIGRIV